MRTFSGRESAVLVGLLSVLVGCSSPAVTCEGDCADGGDVRDAGAREDAGRPGDGGREFPDSGPSDAGGVDGGRDADVVLDSGSPDAGPDGGQPPECEPVAQTGCAAGETCRTWHWVEVSPGTFMGMHGTPYCDESGTLPEHETETDCRDSDDQDLCAEGLFCRRGSWGCVRYCDPAGDPCPDFWSATHARWFTQRCETAFPGPAFCACEGSCVP